MKTAISKNILTVALVTIPVISCGLLTSCSAMHQQESTGQFIDGSVITTKVKAKLLADKYVSGLPITVKTYKNTVQLSGFVNSQSEKNRAIKIAESIEGVYEVQDSMTVKQH